MTQEQKTDKEQKMSEKEELEAMIAMSTDNLEYLTEEANKLAKKQNTIIFDFEKIQKQSEIESNNIIHTSAAFYLSEDTINSVDYIQQKISADAVIMSDLLRQSKIAEHAIYKMLEQIEEGDMHPRTFEVLAGFQKTKLELTQAISKQITLMSEEYKLLKSDYEKISTQSANVIDVSDDFGQVGNDGSLTTMGTRNIMQSIRSELDRKATEDRKAAMEETMKRQEEENKNRKLNGNQ